MTHHIQAAAALLADGWADDVSIAIDAGGTIESITPNSPDFDGERVAVLIPAIPNVHSHAHQRAMAGLGERAGGDAADSFWTWRQVMYHYLERLGPDHLHAIAAQLYVEMLKRGYGCVGEFQYLHHDPAGKAYAERAEMSLQCLAAARAVGIGFTALPVLYRYGGFGGAEPVAGQKRFLNDADEFNAIVARLIQATAGDAGAAVGIAPHSLRAIDETLLREVVAAHDDLAAIHIHIAEQTREVDDCVAWSGTRPVDWLCDHFDVDAGWCLIHATHMSDDESARLAASGAVAGLCPTTEANLGDGFFNAAQYFDAGGAWAIGSDSHISIDPVEELRWLEYGLRLQTRRRSLASDTATPNPGRYLLDGALTGGARACGRKIGSIAVGYRADLVVLDANHPRLHGRARNDLLDSWIFSGNENLVRDVYIDGRKVIDAGHHADEARIANAYRAALDDLAN